MKHDNDESKLSNADISFERDNVPPSSELFQLANENYDTGSPWSINGFEQDLETNHAHYGVVLYNNECIGFIGYHQILNEAEITNFVIAKKFQRQGIAAKLLQSCLKKLNTEGIENVFLEVRESNQSAIRLYKKNRFVKIGLRKNYYHHPKEHALIMQLTFKELNV